MTASCLSKVPARIVTCVLHFGKSCPPTDGKAPLRPKCVWQITWREVMDCSRGRGGLEPRARAKNNLPCSRMNTARRTDGYAVPSTPFMLTLESVLPFLTDERRVDTTGYVLACTVTSLTVYAYVRRPS